MNNATSSVSVWLVADFDALNFRFSTWLVKNLNIDFQNKTAIYYTPCCL
ncbi:hypothetical protein SAMN04488009_2278 [Maribacter sedimenticola]|uniref:Uncharacterized protein n=1 Tax=Maribacter sedimenticola TaxID=228956 RepID=A0ABY1SHL1_9FLAO|nr:hypothetical protein SAMN04488009_2278 [Maribacter sedimenticola]